MLQDINRTDIYQCSIVKKLSHLGKFRLTLVALGILYFLLIIFARSYDSYLTRDFRGGRYCGNVLGATFSSSNDAGVYDCFKNAYKECAKATLDTTSAENEGNIKYTYLVNKEADSCNVKILVKNISSWFPKITTCESFEKDIRFLKNDECISVINQN